MPPGLLGFPRVDDRSGRFFFVLLADFLVFTNRLIK